MIVSLPNLLTVGQRCLRNVPQKIRNSELRSQAVLFSRLIPVLSATGIRLVQFRSSAQDSEKLGKRQTKNQRLTLKSLN
jgi:hypothetical protein